jgi:hypothetical protein
MHNMLNLNKFHNFYQVLEKNPRLCFLKKKVQRLIKNVLKNIWPKILTINTLGNNVNKMNECDKNQVAYCNVRNFKKWIFWEFWAIDRTWTHWIPFIILIFISEKNIDFRCLYNIRNKSISFDIRKKRENLK